MAKRIQHIFICYNGIIVPEILTKIELLDLANPQTITEKRYVILIIQQSWSLRSYYDRGIGQSRFDDEAVKQMWRKAL